MTDTTDDHTPDAADRSEGTTADDSAEQETTDNPGREAAKYRVRLRETEAERDRLAEVLGTYRRRDVETMAEAAGMARGADLFDLGADLGELLTDEGAVDEAKVRDAVSAVLTERPHWGAPAPTFDLGIRGGFPSKSSPDWSDVLRGQ